MRDSIFPLIGGGTSNTGGSRLTPLHSRIAKIIGRCATAFLSAQIPRVLAALDS
jgi:hypothetical protein